MSPTSASVVVRLNSSALRTRLQLSLDASLSSPVFSPAVTTAAAAGNTVTLTVQSLQPDTDYYYGVEVAGVLRTEPESRGRFHTFPLGRGSFKIAFSSCSDFRVGDQRAFDAIAAERPLLFIHMGDLHYIDTNTSNPDDYRANYDSVLNHPNESALYRSTALAYMWDDHDSMGNDCDGTAVGRDTARAVYKERTPHYPIAAAGGAIAQSFTVGRVRIIMTDLHSASSSSSQKETASKSRMGTTQKAWFKQELINARDAGFPLILWVCTDPWIGTPELGADSWAGFATERVEIANFIRDNHLSNVVLLSGDMHALAYDDGTHSDYATGGGAPLQVLQAASLTSPGAAKGGPYTEGPIIGPPQYGILEVYDTGGPSIACRFLGMKAGEGVKLSYIFSTGAPALGGVALVNLSTLAGVKEGGETLVSGFTISGNSPRTMLVRAVGPTLATFGVGEPLNRPRLAIYQGARLVGSNDAWGATDDAVGSLTAAFDRTGAFRLADTASRDAALLLTLAPGSYSAEVKSADATSGKVLLEIYEVP